MKALLLLAAWAGAAGPRSLPPLPRSAMAVRVQAAVPAPRSGPGAPAVAGAPTAADVHKPGVIGLVQYNGDARFGDYDANMAALTAMAEEAVARGSKIVVLPEGSAYGYASKDELWCKPGMTDFHGRKCRDVSQIAESIPGGRTSRHWEAFSKRHGVYVIFSIPEAAEGKFYNALGVTGPEGHVMRYRKRLLYKTDKAYADAGTDPGVLETECGKFGLLICLDADPSAGFFKQYAEMGVDAAIISMDWDDDPQGAYAAKKKFREWALDHKLDIYASDAAPWDGTAKYLASGRERERAGLAPDAVGQSGVTTHPFHYPRKK